MDTTSQSGNDASSPEVWVERHGDALFRYAVLRVRDRHVAEDLVQDTFLAAIKGSKGDQAFRGESQERTWLVGILRHKLIDHLRKSGREVTVADRGADGEDTAVNGLFDRLGWWKSDHNEWAGANDDLVEKAEFWTVFKGCLEALPSTQQEAFTLKTIDDMPAEEICKVLSISPTNLWVMLHRARLRLRSCLEAKWFERDPSESK